MFSLSAPLSFAPSLISFFFSPPSQRGTCREKADPRQSNFSQPFLICWDRWLGTQWTGGDPTARYAAQRARAEAALDAKAPAPSPLGNGAPTASRKANGITSANGVARRRGHGIDNDNSGNDSDSDRSNDNGNGNCNDSGNGIAATSGFANGNGHGKTLAFKINGHSPLTGLRELTPPSDSDAGDGRHDEAAALATSAMAAEEEDVRRSPRKRMATRAA